MIERIFSYTLDNGLRIFVRPHDGAELATVVAGVATGSIHEQEMLGCGVSHYLEHLLFQGSEGYPGDAAARTINQLGGEFNAYTSYTHTAYYTELPAKNTTGAIDVLAAMVRAPEIPEAKFLSERDVILRERDMRRDRPESRLIEALWESAYLRHPVRYPIIGYGELIAQVSREMLLTYHHRRYTPGRVFFVVSGRVEPEAVRDHIAARLGEWRRSGLEDIQPAGEAMQLAMREVDGAFPDPLARLAIGFQLPSASDPVIPAAELLTGLIGQNPSSVLIRELWQEQELANDLGAFAYAPGCPGLLGIAGSAVPEKLSALEAGIFEELNKLRRRGFDAEELRLEKLRRIADDRRELRSGRDWAFQLAETIAATGSPLTPEAYYRKLNAVTTEDLMQVLEEFLDESRANIVRLYPEEQHAAVAPDQTCRESSIEPGEAWAACPVLRCKDDSAGLIDLIAVLPGGSFWETAENNGISCVLASVLTAGAGKFKEGAFAEWLDANAVEATVTAGTNSIIVRLNAPRESEEELWEIFRTMLVLPRFDAQPVKRECANFQEGLKSRAGSVAAADDLARRTLFGDHPFGLPKGTVACVKRFKSADLRTFYRDLWRKRQVVLGIAGAFDVELAQRNFAELSAELPWHECAAKVLPPEPEFAAGLKTCELPLDREQCRVIHLIPGMTEGAADRLALEVLLQAENGLTAHLFQEVRENRSLAYSTGVGAYSGRHRGYIALYAGCEYERGAEVALLLRDELRHLAENGLSEEEFAAARLAVEMRFARRREDAGEYLLNAMFSEYFGNGYGETERQARELNALDRDTVNAVLKRYCATAVGVTVCTVKA